MPQDWYAVTPDASVTIPVSGWSAAPRPDWLLYPAIAMTDPSGVFAAGVHDGGVTSQLGLGTSGECYPREAMNNGTTASITVAAPAGAMSGDYIVLRVDSFDEKPSPSCYPPIAEDNFHFSLVGVYVP